jgi:hypothetical protein
VHSAVWSLVEMESWLICVNKFFHFALKHYFISKQSDVSDAPYTVCWCKYGENLKNILHTPSEIDEAT